jgi:antitoxin component YwqK of YwqJK toxin-antitoxin module
MTRLNFKPMKKTLLLSLLFALLYACSHEIERVVVQIYPDGKVELEQYFIFENNDSILIKETGFYPDGSLRIEGEYKEGKRDGRWVYWYDNGNKWSEARYKADIRDGKSTVWHENGRKYFEGSYKMGERIGKWRFWDEEGNLLKEINYDK